MAKANPCDYCKNDMPLSVNSCPHCSLPGLFPNVRAARDSGEHKELEKRYKQAQSASTARGAAASLNSFETAVASSKAVISRSVNEIQRLVNSDNEVYATYYQWLEGGLRIPVDDKWKVLRPVVDSALFPDYKEHIRFAALTLDGHGLTNYGECSIVLRENMIAHRASVFEENSVLFMKHHNILVVATPSLPSGYRAVWEEREKLCVAKLHNNIDAATRPDEYSRLLIRQGASSEEDEFVEVHIYGSMTARTIEHVNISPRVKRRGRATILKAVKEKLQKAGATIS